MNEVETLTNHIQDVFNEYEVAFPTGADDADETWVTSQIKVMTDFTSDMLSYKDKTILNF